MAISENKRILAALRREGFIGRRHEVDALVQIAAAEENSRGAVILASPGAGLSELMRQVFDELFRLQKTLPFYFELRGSDESAEAASSRFLREFLVQSLAFLRSEPAIIAASPPISELAELARPVGSWYAAALDQLARPENNLAVLQSRLHVPARAAAAGVRSLVMIDGLHDVLKLEGGHRLLEHFNELSGRLKVILGARRRFGGIAATGDRIQLTDLSFNEACELVATRASEMEILINDQTRDLMAVQFDGNPLIMSAFLNTRTAADRDLQSFKKFSGSYAREMSAGTLGLYFDELLDSIIPDKRHQKDLIENLYYGVVRNERLVWERPDDIDVELFRRAEEVLDISEIINTEPGIVLHDYIVSRHRMMVENKTSTAVTSELVTTGLKRAPQLMARHYRRLSSIGLKQILAGFDCQQIPAALLDYRAFRDNYKGLADSEILSSISNDQNVITLPQIAHVDHAAEFYPPIAQVTDVDRAVVGVGFNERTYTDDEEIAWLAAEIDSKLEAERSITEFWCDRLEVVALAANLRNFRIWLVSPEGFSEDGLEVLRSRGALGSSRKQVELLSQYVTAGPQSAPALETDEYEIVVPMGEDTELIAAHAVEEVAKRRNFPPKAINQIKTALVEACINATEHSLSPDRKIYQKFTVDKNKIVITVSNRGIRLTDRATTINELGSGRRGWGLNLMKGLMDEVKIEQVDDGTRISMTKYL